MNKSIWSRRLLKYAAIPVGAAVILYLLWVGMQGLGSANIIAGAALLLFIAYMLNLRRSEARADQDILRRIKAEYAPESQPQVLDLYNRLKAKELEYLFIKVLDDAKGNLNEAKKLAGLAETVGWKDFLENHW